MVPSNTQFWRTNIDIKSEVIILESYEFILKQTSEGAMLKTAARRRKKKEGGGGHL